MRVEAGRAGHALQRASKKVASSSAAASGRLTKCAAAARWRRWGCADKSGASVSHRDDNGLRESGQPAWLWLGAPQLEGRTRATHRSARRAARDVQLWRQPLHARAVQRHTTPRKRRDCCCRRHAELNAARRARQIAVDDLMGTRKEASASAHAQRVIRAMKCKQDVLAPKVSRWQLVACRVQVELPPPACAASAALHAALWRLRSAAWCSLQQ